jgi:hypothetical protein
MTVSHEISAAEDLGVEASTARPLRWLVAGFISFIAVSGLWASDARC